MGGRGERIAQCSHVNISTSKAIPMQVDGEPCLLAPSVIAIKFHSKVIIVTLTLSLRKLLFINLQRNFPAWLLPFKICKYW